MNTFISIAKRSLVVFIGIFSLTAILYAKSVLAVQVGTLPEGNLLLNPWFRSDVVTNAASLNNWIIDTAKNTNGEVLWSISQKRSNPSADVIVSGKCGANELYCGTAARFASGYGQGGYGFGINGYDAYLYQIVQADPANTTLQFQTEWVTGWIDQATITIYSSNSADGPWSPVWVPLSVSDSTGTGSNHAWTSTGFMETNIPDGASFYKVEIQAQYPANKDQGAKFTGVYFNVVDLNSLPTPTPSPSPTPTPSPSPTPTPSPSPTPTPSPSPTPMPSPSPTPITGNNAPVIATPWLSSTVTTQSYSFQVRGQDADLQDTLSMAATGLPTGLVLGNCNQNSRGASVRITCEIFGTAQEVGTYYPEIILTDSAGATDSKVYTLVVN